MDNNSKERNVFFKQAQDAIVTRDDGGIGQGLVSADQMANLTRRSKGHEKSVNEDKE